MSAPAIPRAAPLPRRVFCVDDDPVHQRILMVTLARPGWAVECAANGRDALERFADKDRAGFDVLVTDHSMPFVNGLELVRALRQRGFSGPVIVTSANVEPEDRTAYFEAGVLAVLTKPVVVRQLRELVDRGAESRPTLT